MTLPEYAVRNRIVGNMLTVVVFAAGLMAALTLPREFFPPTDLDIVVVTTRYPNAAAREVEDLVTIPIENELRGAADIETLTSHSVEHLSTVIVTVDPEARNRDRVINDISRRINQVSGLPADAGTPEMLVFGADQAAVHLLVGGTAGERAVRRVADRLKARLEGIPGVSHVQRLGWRDPEIWVEVDADALDRHELSLQEVAYALARRNVNLPGGTIAAEARDVVLRTVGRFQRPEDIGAAVVRSNPDGYRVRVADIAQTTPAFGEHMTRLRAHGGRGVALTVIKKAKGDTIRIADETKAIVAQERDRLPDGIVVSVIDLEAYLIRRRLNVLLSNGLIGLGLVLGALPLLLNLRIALVTALGIPFAFLVALLTMAWMGITINMLTMMGIILVVGMLVDDAIIIAENSFHYLEEGYAPAEAAARGGREVMWPVTATVLTTIAAFAPLLFLPGLTGRFMRWIPMMVIIALLASLFEALVILPCHIADLARPVAGRRRGASGRWSRQLQAAYVRLLDAVLSRRALFVGGVLMLALLSAVVARRVLRVDLFPADLVDYVQINVTLPVGTPRDLTENRIADIKRIVRARLSAAELNDMFAVVGEIGHPNTPVREIDSRVGMVHLYLTPADTRERTARDMVDDLRRAMAPLTDSERIDFETLVAGPPVGKPVHVRVIGADEEAITAVARELEAFLPSVGATGVFSDNVPGKDELRVTVDDAEAGRLGLDVATVGQTVYAAFQGLEATVMRDAGEEITVRVKLAEPHRGRAATLRRLRAPNRMGRLVEIDRVAAIATGPGVAAIHRYDGERAVSVFGDVGAGATPRTIAAAVRDRFGDIDLRYPGCRIAFGGEYEEHRKTLRGMMRAMAMALVLIYAILAIQFRSFLQPFTVLVSVPFGLIGVVLALMLHGKPVSMMALLGMVGMTGVVVNDAIVLVSFINDLRRAGMPLREAIIEGSRRRVRAILLTSVTTVLGLAPVIYGIGGYEPFVAPAAIVLAYGLVFATFLTLLVVPCVYSLGVELKQRFGRRGA